MRFLVLLVSIINTAEVLGYSLYTYHGPPAPLDHDGKVIETPEVAHARAAHLAAHAEAVSRIESDVDHWPDVYEHEKDGNDIEEEKNQFGDDGLKPVYHGPPAPLGKDGRVVDTPEVAHAKAAHLAAFSKAYAAAPKSDPHHEEEKDWENEHHNHVSEIPAHPPYTIYHVHKHYKGPPAPLSPDGRVIDTPEVEHARAAHLAAHAHAHVPTIDDDDHHLHQPDHENCY